jgi:exonuclease SbcD
MRFLHTGDWHVGKTIRGRSRMDEFERALDQVVEIALDQNVDAVLHAGDLYEHRAAAPDADKMVFETLLRLTRTGCPSSPSRGTTTRRPARMRSPGC